MNVDITLQNAYKALKAVRWHDFREVGGDEPYYDWYYAESQLYVIRDRQTEQYLFLHATSPLKALEQLRSIDQIEDVMCDGK